MSRYINLRKREGKWKTEYYGDFFVANQLFPGPSPQPSPTPSSTPVTPTPTPTVTPTPSSTSIPVSPTPTPTNTGTPNPTSTPTPSVTSTITPTPTLTPTNTPTPSSTPAPPSPIPDLEIVIGQEGLPSSIDDGWTLLSDEGYTYTGYTASFGQRWLDGVYSSGLFVKASNKGSRLWYSYDGLNYSEVSTPGTSRTQYKVIWVDYLSKFVSVGQFDTGYEGTPDELVSTTVRSFTKPSGTTTNIFTDLTNNMMVLTNLEGELHTATSDFSNWTLQTTATSSIETSIHNEVFGKSYIFIPNTTYKESTDNITWGGTRTRPDIGTLNREGVTYRPTDGLMLLVGQTEGSVTSDGSNWTGTTFPSTVSGGTWEIGRYVSGAELFIIGATDGSIAVSSDGFNWSLRTNPLGYGTRIEAILHKYPRTISTESSLDILTENNDTITTDN